MFSIVILTLNEEQNLETCLCSLKGVDDILVLDSGSTDRTAEIAKAAGARVALNPFVDFATQRNFANRMPWPNSWVFHLDADERFTPELLSECMAVSESDPKEVDGYFAAPKMLFRGKWIPRCTDFPAYQARFVRADRFRFIQVGHGQREAPGLRLLKLRSHYLHDLSADGENALVEKHRRYAREEAIHAASVSGYSIHPRELFSSHALARRRALKGLSRYLPVRGAMRFVYQYVLRGGFLDGRSGLAYCFLLARYEHWIARETRLLRQKQP